MSSGGSQYMTTEAGLVVPRQDAAVVTREDCGPGGCGPSPGWASGAHGGLDGAFYDSIGLSQDTITVLCKEQLLYTIVAALVDDACRDRPTLSGETGELTDCIEWLADRGWFEAQRQALFYSRQAGGGGVVCFIDDGRPAEEEVDITAIRDVEGFYALPKWYLIPADAGSDRIRAGWYGGRIGRPERYWMTPIVPPSLSAAGGSGRNARDVGHAVLEAGGRLYHRSRIVPWPYRTDLDLRQARRFANWAGWGPGVVEGCIDAYLARRAGAMKTVDILQSSHFNVMTTPNVAHAQSTPDGGSALWNVIQWTKDCLAATSGGAGTLPFVVVDPVSKLEAQSHTLSGISDILKEERRFLLDNLPEYTEVRLFGSSSSGLSGDGKEGEMKTYYGNVSAWQRSVLWTAGSFGGGMQQAVRLSMLAQSGPTRGQMDKTCAPVWPSQWSESGLVQAQTGKMNAERRAIDRVTLTLTPAAFLRHDPTLAGSPSSTYPSLDVDEGPLPVLASQALPGASTPDALAPPVAAGPGGGPAAPLAASTPASALSSIAEASQPTTGKMGPGGVPMQDSPDFDPPEPPAPVAPPPPPLAMPADIANEVDLAATLGMSRATFRKWALARGVQVYPVDKGTRGGHRYSLGAVLTAWEKSARSRMDALRASATGHGAA